MQWHGNTATLGSLGGFPLATSFAKTKKKHAFCTVQFQRNIISDLRTRIKFSSATLPADMAAEVQLSGCDSFIDFIEACFP